MLSRQQFGALALDYLIFGNAYLQAVPNVFGQLLGIVPKNGTGFGNVIDAVRAFYHLEIVPLQARLSVVNEWLGEEVVSFAEPLDIALLQPTQPSVKG